MRRSTATTVLSSATLALALASGCAPVDDGVTEENTGTLTSEASRVRPCPEPVTLASDGQPRNADGHIRQCWPGEAHCKCDQDNDCYARARYRACVPMQGAADAETPSTGTTEPTDTTSRPNADTATPPPSTTADAGSPTRTPPADAGSTTPPPSTAADAGTRDAGSTPPPPPADAGTRDAGSTPPPPPADAGTRTPPPPPADAGTPAPTPSPTPTPAPSGAVPTVGGCQIFPADNPWNQEITSLPVASNSDAVIANIQAHGDPNLHADFGSDPSYGIPFVVVPQSQSMVPVNFTEFGDESDPGPYPIPAGAPIEGGNDHHVLVVQQGACMLYEMYHSSPSGSGWNAGSGAVFDLSSNALRPRGWTSCDQAGLPILAGLTRYDEADAGEIRHALRVTFDHTRDGFIAPATHPGGEADVNAPPMGMRLRLKSSFDVSRFTGHARVMLNAMRRYGLIVADTGSNWFISGGTDRRWNDDDLRQLTNVPGTAFEVVNTGPVQSR